MKKTIIGAAALTCSLLFGQPVLADSDNECGEGLKNMLSSLHLTSDQQKKIEGYKEEAKKTIMDKAQDMKNLQTKIKDEMKKKDYNANTVDGYIDDKAKDIGEIMKAKMKLEQNIASVLDPKQKEKFDEERNKRQEKMEQKYEKCHHHEM